MKFPELSVSRRGILVCLIQLALIGSLAGKLWYDRATLPRVWVRCSGVDPDSPLRGRYVVLQLNVFLGSTLEAYGPVRLRVDGNLFIAQRVVDNGAGAWDGVSLAGRANGEPQFAVLDPPVSVFLAEHVPDPTVLKIGEELWVEVTVPPEGPPRPIQLGIKRPNAAIVPLDVD